MTEYTIAPCTPEMLEDITEIEQRSFSVPWTAESLRQASEMENGIFLTVLREGKAVGFGCILLVAGEGELVDIAVSPEHRKKGLGQMLMTALLKKAAEAGTENLYLEVRRSNTPAKTLYEKNGFAPIGVRKNYYKNPVEDAILMHCVLPAQK